MSEKLPYTAPEMEIFGAPDSRGDLISREAAKEFARHAMAKGLNVLEYLDEVPATDFRPVARGEWVSIDDFPQETWTCDHCGAVVGCTDDPWNYYHFCSWCGTDMRKEAPKEK